MPEDESHDVHVVNAVQRRPEVFGWTSGDDRAARWRTVGIVRIVFGRGTPVIDKAHRNQLLRPAVLLRSGEFGITLAVRDHNRQPAARHGVEKQ